ncbi:hypothetical protein BY458DRAFT_527307 [Sporodiniella umbellata]|nr:hypothetical protein BY458DRAFT_527307 [Sporodiniella umbellata]
MNNQLSADYEHQNTCLMSEKLPGIDTLPKLDETFQDKESELSSTQGYLPPPGYSFHSLQPPYYSEEISPPLTPAVSPSSVLLDSMQFKRKFSIDVGPFGFGTHIPSAMQPSHGEDADAFRRSSCSAMSIEEYPTESTRPLPSHEYYMNEDTSLNHSLDRSDITSPEVSSQSGKRRGSRAHLQGPSTQHKHGCTYPFCTWSFKRYEHLKRHLLVHTGKRPHACHFPGCGKRFSRSDNYHAHYRTHTKKLQQQQHKKTLPASTAAAASVAATAAAAVASVNQTAGNNNNSMTPAPQVFDERSAYFAKQHFDMNYPDIYGHHYHHHHHHHHPPSQQPSQQPHSRHHHHHHHHNSNSNNTATINAITSPRNSFPEESTAYGLRHMNTFDMPSSHVPSLLNHEVAPPTNFFPQESDRNFGYPMNPLMSAAAAAAAAAAANTAYGYPPYMTPTSTHITSPHTTSSLSPSPRAEAGRRTSTSHGMASTKSHVCPIPQCQRSFKRLEHLKRHMRIHTLERPFTCSFPNCHKTFSRSDNLSQHMKTHQRTEDRRRRQQQPSQEFNMNKPQDLSHESTTPMLNSMVGISWHSANTGTVGC